MADLGDAHDEPDTGVPPCLFCRREVPCECGGEACMCTCGRCAPDDPLRHPAWYAVGSEPIFARGACYRTLFDAFFEVDPLSPVEVIGWAAAATGVQGLTVEPLRDRAVVQREDGKALFVTYSLVYDAVNAFGFVREAIRRELS